ncbi:MAG: hypothetical protein ACSLEW_09695 [Nocardioides sp.]
MTDRQEDPRDVVLDHDTGMVVGSYRRSPSLVGRALGAAGALIGLGRKAVDLPRTLANSPQAGVQQQTASVVVEDRFGKIDLTPEDLEVAFPQASGRVVVFVPPQGAGVEHWQQNVAATGSSYGERLQALLGWTPVTLRHRPASSARAGVELAAVLQRLVDQWPVPVERLALVADADGGLVVRRAAGLRQLSATPWPALVSDVVLLGTTPFAAGSRPLTGPFGRRADATLGGIASSEEAYPAPELAATYRLVSNRANRTPTALGQLLGNLLWLRHRAGPAAVELFPSAQRIHAASGPTMANHPQVHSDLLNWLR